MKEYIRDTKSNSTVRKFLMAAAVCLSITIAVSAQTADTQNYGALKLRSEENYYDLALDSMITETAQQSYENFKREFIDIPLDGIPVTLTPDSVYDRRLRMLATEIQLPYNEIVRKYIEIYTRPGGIMSNVLGRGRYYFPIIEKYLYKYNLPMELKMLPVIESAMIPTARSRAGAVGLWQFMLSTAKSYGLEISSFVDERTDAEKATDAACRMLRDMYRMYGDWTLVIASYNCGSGNVNKAIKRAGNAGTYWDIWPYLPAETRNYVPAFIAATYGYTFHKSYGVNPTKNAVTLAIDTVMINKMMHLEQVSSTIDIPLDELRSLNPEYIRDVVPAAKEQYKLKLPQRLVGTFLDSLDTIYAKDTIYLTKYLANNNITKEEVASAKKIVPRVVYKVKSGDSLGRIAAKHKVTVKQIQKWNNLKGTNLKVGQKLSIY